jgi:hypothetical protein
MCLGKAAMHHLSYTVIVDAKDRSFHILSCNHAKDGIQLRTNSSRTFYAQHLNNHANATKLLEDGMSEFTKDLRRTIDNVQFSRYDSHYNSESTVYTFRP